MQQLAGDQGGGNRADEGVDFQEESEDGYQQSDLPLLRLRRAANRPANSPTQQILQMPMDYPSAGIP
jgi:hypothetical protein